MKPCEVCGKEFIESRMGQKVCGWKCAEKVPKIARKAVKVAKQVERAADKVLGEKQKKLPKLKSEAQVPFNAYCKERDRQAGYPCISSGKALDWSGNRTDAGHYRSVGAAQHLRYNEDNCHAQSKHDNRWLAGNAVDYRLGLVARIGLERVEALENDNVPHKWTREDLTFIKALYIRKLKELKKAAV